MAGRSHINGVVRASIMIQKRITIFRSFMQYCKYLYDDNLFSSFFKYSEQEYRHA